MSKFGKLFDDNGVVKLAPRNDTSPAKERHPVETKLDRERDVCIGCTKAKCYGSEKCVAKRKAQLEKEQK